MGEPVADRRIAAIAVLVFERGGVAGAVRRVVFGWRGRFSAAQIHIAVSRRWPLLAPNQHQVGDCLDRLEKQRLIECVLCKHSKIYQRSYAVVRQSLEKLPRHQLEDLLHESESSVRLMQMPFSDRAAAQMIHAASTELLDK